MKISTKGRYAMRLLIDLNENQGDGFVALKDIAQRQSISKKYLEQIVPALTAEGVLKASRGFQGGYRLAREPEDMMSKAYERWGERHEALERRAGRSAGSAGRAVNAF